MEPDTQTQEAPAPEKQKAINLPSGHTVESVLVTYKKQKDTAFKYQKRRHERWKEIYEFYRNRIRINKLTQRQAVNVPLMKETISTLTTKVNSEVDARLSDKGGDVDKEIAVNTMWQQANEDQLFNLQDRVDKKQCLLYGRSHFSLNVDNSREIPVYVEVEDIFDILVDPKTKPWDIDTARFVSKINMYKPIQELEKDPARYDAETVKKLKEDTKSSTYLKNRQDLEAKNDRLRAMGVDNVDELEGSDDIISLTGHIMYLWDKDAGKHVRYYLIVANDTHLLSADTMLNTLGVDFIPFETEAVDLEITDYWSDGIGDLILVPNKMINIWLSQYMENRTLRSFGMNFYDSSVDGFTPPTFDPRPGGWYGIPGKYGEAFQNVPIPSLDGTLEDIQFIVATAERASATGAVEKGVVEEGKRTLGEIQLAIGNSMQRTNDMDPIFNTCRERLIAKWYKMMAANASNSIKLYRPTTDGALIERELQPEEWISEKGYKVAITDKNQRLINVTEEIQRFKVLQSEFPMNMALRKAVQKRMIKLVDLSTAEADEIMQEEIKNIEQGIMAQPQQMQQPQALPMPQIAQ